MALKRILPAALALACFAQGPAFADKIKHPIAVFAGLDKITARIFSFEVNIGETVEFGTLQVTPRVCYTRPPTEPPRTDAFVEVGQLDADKKYKSIFSGWMFADSPGLHGVEDPVYDVWLTDCKGGKDIIKEAKPADEAMAPAPSEAPPDAAPDGTPTPKPTKKPRKIPNVINAPLDLAPQ